MSMKMEIRPLTFKTAKAFIKEAHRHHKMVVGGKFSIGVYRGDELVGVAICGRPVSRYLDDGLTLEVNRCCTIDGTKNACSMLYGACCRIARDMGYKKVVTYTLQSEKGVSLKASNFTLESETAGGIRWTGARSKRESGAPKELKKRWARIL